MSSGGESYGGASSDDEPRNRRSHPSSSSAHRRQPVELPDDDDSDHETPPVQQQHRSSSKSRHQKSTKRSPREYDEDEDHEGEIDEEDNIKANIKRKNNVNNSSDNEYDDEYDEEDNNRSNRNRGNNNKLNNRKRAHSDEEDDEDDRINKDYKKAKKEDYEVNTNNNTNNNTEYASSDGEINEDEENNNSKSEKMSMVEKEIEKSKLNNRRRRNEPDPSVIENECVTFLERMKKARDLDLESFKRKQPALEKIKMLRDVENMMTKVCHREYLLDSMLLAAFRSWLDRLPDGSLPNIQVRTTLLNILFDLKIDEDWVERLESSQGLGKIIHYLSKKDDHNPNKRLAEKIMMKWARPVYRMNSNFNELLYEFDKPDEGYKAGRESVAAERKAAMRTVQRIRTTEEKLRDSRKNNDKSNKIMATVPRPTPFLFTTVAEGTTDMDEKEAKEIRVNRAKQKRMSRTISNLRRLSKASGARGDKPSLNGR